ncbi:MAG: glycosyltransferase family 39 protein [Firmicutes bacterium]|nr:glycosyltransferase family 39 protein [Bacillota bacterium]
MSRNIAYVAAAVLLLTMLGMLILDAKSDSATMDEPTHIAAGYTYVNALDYRLNPEHPPLAKDLMGLAVSTMQVKYPFDFFYRHISLEYENGYKFLFHSGNDADAILFRGRLAIISVTVILAIFVFLWSTELNGTMAGLFSLLLFAFDPNIIAHGHLATMDMAISAAFLINLYFIWKYLTKRSKPLLIASGVTAGLALLTKFSALLLLPVYIALILYIATKGHEGDGCRFELKRLKDILAIFTVICLIGFIVFFLGYTINMLHMPSSVQADIINLKLSERTPFLASFLSNIDLRPITYYILGLTMVGNHVAGGHSIFLLGRVTQGVHYYYPVVFVLKSTLPTLILSTLILAFGRRVRSQSRLAEVALISSILVFGAAAIMGKLNLGLRYVLPVYPLLYVYAGKLVNLFKFDSLKQNSGELLHRFGSPKIVLNISLIILGIWQVITCLAISPYHLSYFNEIIGPTRGSQVFSDSNVDWGQDLRRLHKYVEDNEIDRIYIDYFGGSIIEYYFGNKAVKWSGKKSCRPHGWFAISVTNYNLETAQGKYRWLRNYKPYARIGYSILVYKLP